jgi:plastocyanin
MWRLGLMLLAAALPLAGGGRTHTIVVSQFRYTPPVLTVAAGDTVVWDNRDVVPHTATANGGAWDSGDIAAKSRRVLVLRKQGEFTYDCLYHSNMKGKLIVR